MAKFTSEVHVSVFAIVCTTFGTFKVHENGFLEHREYAEGVGIAWFESAKAFEYRDEIINEGLRAIKEDIK